MTKLVMRGVTAAVILAGGLALFLARGALAPRLARWPDLGSRPPREEPVEDVTPAVLAEPVAEDPSAPQLSYPEIEAMLAPLPGRVLELVAEGRRELPEYRDMASRNEARASRGRRFFEKWGRTWANRVERLEKDTPPRDECEVHTALAPACALLAEAYAALRSVPEASRIEEAEEHLDRVRQRVDEFLNPPEEEEGAGGEVLEQ